MKKNNIDTWLLAAVLCLVVLGTVMIYSASSVWAQMKYVDANFFLKRQIFRAVLGLALMILVTRIDYHWYRPFALPFLLAIFVLLIYIVISNDVEVIRGSTRWITLGTFNVQPSEYMKYALILYMADAIERKQTRLGSFWHGYIPLALILGVSMLLIVLQPDLGTTIVLGMIITVLFFVGKMRIWHLGLSFAVTAAGVYFMVKHTPYQLRRIMVYLNPDSDPLGQGYQIKQSLISIGHGGIFGQGLGQSTQKLLYLPEPYTDFIFSILGEELGFVGTLGVVILFLIVMWRGILIARNAPDMFGCLLGVGLMSSVVIGALVNISVVSNLIPTTGLPLPFISYGGNSLLLSLVGIGILLNISTKIVPDSLKPGTAPFIVAQLRKQGRRFEVEP